VTVTTLTFGPAAALTRRPVTDLLADRPIDPRTALGGLFAPAFEYADEIAIGRRVAEAPRRLLAELADGLALLPQRERERVAILIAWVEALMATAEEDDAAELRLARLNRSAYLLARSLAGEPSDAPFVRAFAAESARRSFTRPALDALLAVARHAVERPRPTTREELDRRARALASAFATAVVGADPGPEAEAAATAIHRLLALRRLPRQLACGRSCLPVADLAEPLQFRRDDEIAAAVAAECESIRPLLLRGARALAEVPLTFRRPLAYLLSAALDLLGQIEVHPEAVIRREPRLGRWARAATLWRIRRQPLG
jgi:phytoene/squalene synthetase